MLEEIARMILNEDGNGLSDEEFAELFVMLGMRTTDSPTAEQIKSFDIKSLNWINESVDEIINEDCCASAWWKK